MVTSGDGLWVAYLTILVGTLLVQFVTGYWVYRNQRNRNGARWFLVMNVAGVVWILGFLVFLLPVDPTVKAVGNAVSGFGVVTSISAFVVFVSKYMGNGLHRSPYLRGLLGSLVVAYLLLAPTNGVHGLLFTDYRMVADPFPHLAFERGPAFVVMVALIHVPVAYSVYLMVTHLLATRRRPGTQLTLFVAGASVIAVLDLLSEYTGVMPVDGFTHAPFGVFAFSAFTALSLFRFSLLDVKPVARNTVIENLRDPVLVLDDVRRIVDYNEAATRVWPDLGERVQEPFEDVCSSLAERVTVPPDGQGSRQVTVPVDGQERHYSVTVSAVSNRRRGRAGWYSILLRDVTELERSRWQLRTQNERLDQVASTISHDLRNPINVANGHVELLRATLDGGDGLSPEEVPTVLDHLEQIDESHQRMVEIIADVLTIAREGKTVEETEPLDLGAIAREAYDNVDTKDASLSVTDTRTLRADRSKLLTIFENLFRNAVDHGPDDVTIEVGVTDDGFHVADDGPGIPETHHDSIFEYGYTTSQAGTGLGLSIVETMAESHGWTVEHDGDYPDGTRFVFHHGVPPAGQEETPSSERPSTGTADDRG